MTRRASSRVVVAGAGVVGLAIALTLARSGAKVTLVDPGAGSASGVAAGMLAPAFEATLDPASAGDFELLRACRDLWPGFLLRLGGAEIGLRRTGAFWLDRQGDLEPRAVQLHERLLELGAAARMLSRPQIEALAPGSASTASGGLFTSEDWRLDPSRALSALHAATAAAGCDRLRARVTAFDGEAARLSDGRIVRAGRLVLATGAAGGDLAPELSQLSPIKGHILRYPWRRDDERPVIRCGGGYATPTGDGLMVGATMEAGRNDQTVDPAIVARLSDVGAGIYPALATVAPIPLVGIRAATPDGLPLVGPSAAAGVHLAVGMRRNGWLLAPLVAAAIAADILEQPIPAHASRLDVRRFEAV